MVDRPIARFYAGTNGSGKSTLREMEQDSKINLHIDPDAIARTLARRDGKLDNLGAGREAIRQFQEAIDTRTSFSMETTLTGVSVIKRIEQAKNAGFQIELNYIGLKDADLNVRRVAKRVALGGHDIPEDVIRRRYTEGLENLSKAIELADKTTIMDNSDTYPVPHLLIEDRTMERLTDNPPQWIRELRDMLHDFFINSVI